eukprot:3038419-Rhodomonas_salina.4
MADQDAVRVAGPWLSDAQVNARADQHPQHLPPLSTPHLLPPSAVIRTAFRPPSTRSDPHTCTRGRAFSPRLASKPRGQTLSERSPRQRRAVAVAARSPLHAAVPCQLPPLPPAPSPLAAECARPGCCAAAVGAAGSALQAPAPSGGRGSALQAPAPSRHPITSPRPTDR